MIRNNLIFLGVLFGLCAALMLSHLLGFQHPWAENTMPYRLTHNPVVGWLLTVFLGFGLVLLLTTRGARQVISAAAFAGATLAAAVINLVFFDPALGLMLSAVVSPILRWATSQLKDAKWP